MPVYAFECFAWQANDDIVPFHVVEMLRPGSPLFYIRLTVLFCHPHSEDGPLTTRRMLKIFVKCDETAGLNGGAWEELSNFMTEAGSPVQAMSEMIQRLTNVAVQMMADQANAGRIVLPLEGTLTLTAAAEENEMAGMEPVEVEGEGLKCAICLEEMEAGSMASKLPCMHLYHETCITDWFSYQRSCPICRSLV